MAGFDWHCDAIDDDTPVTGSYKTTQNVRRYMARSCGTQCRFSRGFMRWIRDDQPKTMGEVAAEWLRQNPQP